MTEQTTTEIHPVAALVIAERQNTFDKNEKLLLSQDVFRLSEIVQAQSERIAELEDELSKYQEVVSQ